MNALQALDSALVFPRGKQARADGSPEACETLLPKQTGFKALDCVSACEYSL